MKINWKVRSLSKKFWLMLIPAVLLVVQILAMPFGYKLDIDGISDWLIMLVNAVFAVLMLLGVVVDPTTPNLSDSQRALKYKKEVKK